MRHMKDVGEDDEREEGEVAMLGHKGRGRGRGVDGGGKKSAKQAGK